MPQQITLTWKKLSATVKDKPILADASGYCKPGQLLAVMGPSGSGKTTFLSLLTHKTDRTVATSGSILANKVEYNAESFYNFGTFVYQNDILYQTLTVRETLEIGCKLVFKDPAQAQKRLSQLISEFELQKCADVIVGGQFKKGISGGEMKRLCIAIEMISRPSVIILDEPTSGLDSNKASRVLKVLKKLSTQGHTIIFTIHQPSYLLYSMLDRVIILNFGLTIYQGLANEVEPYLQKLGVEVSKTSTICDFFMMELSDYKKKKLNYETPFNNENYKKYQKKSVKKQSSVIKNTESVVGFSTLDYNQTFSAMFFLLLRRQWLNYTRNPMKFFGMIGNALITVIIVGLIFINSIPSIADIQSIADGSISRIQFNMNMAKAYITAQGTTFVNCTSMIMNGIFSVALAFPLQRPIFYKETTSKKYSPISYFLSKMIIEVSSIISGTILYSSIGYWMLGYEKTFQQFISFVFILVLMSLVGNSIGFFTGSLFKDAKRASGLAPVLILPLMMFSGLYNKLNSIPSWIGWLQYISPFRYGLHMELINQYGDSVVSVPSKGYYYDYKSDLGISLSWLQNFGVLIALSLMFYCLSFLLLRKSKTSISV